uniref:Uncharacterized protein n=1 Tax=Candidatus Kentrum sp. TC TaxID=2126339 RepID=A0A450YK12_9GAMM|nr:MAG: hypothetical protein BECKTC1821E_GA0114239_10158 [Candidatus Kentron sp. TC]VFK57525.1 MAG: hypothetical protein BECKTC1821F_GA0114240_101825 [Candidatus Kentron sp. TC]
MGQWVARIVSTTASSDGKFCHPEAKRGICNPYSMYFHGKISAESGECPMIIQNHIVANEVTDKQDIKGILC